eukprot:763895-Hanusia_phi.AAC.4
MNSNTTRSQQSIDSKIFNGLLLLFEQLSLVCYQLNVPTPVATQQEVVAWAQQDPVPSQARFRDDHEQESGADVQGRRNYMSPWSTGGCLAVSIKLCIVSQEAYNLGLEGHVCELLLEDMHNIKIESGRRKYVAWRKLRGQRHSHHILFRILISAC